jgi:hypothetical protein
VSRPFVPPQSGERFGRWTVTGPLGHSSPGHRTVQCQCDCGTERFVLVDQLRKGRSKSCGCLRAEMTKTLITRTRWRGSHGMRYHPLYGIWQGIMARCYRETDVHFPRWGGRGIKVYEPWHDVRVFVAWIEENLGPRPPRASLDRWPDNNGDYCPGNVRWATARQQQETTRLRRGTDGRFHKLTKQ